MAKDRTFSGKQRTAYYTDEEWELLLRLAHLQGHSSRILVQKKLLSEEKKKMKEQLSYLDSIPKQEDKSHA